jgi:hypothetical protein
VGYLLNDAFQKAKVILWPYDAVWQPLLTVVEPGAE